MQYGLVNLEKESKFLHPVGLHVSFPWVFQSLYGAFPIAEQAVEETRKSQGQCSVCIGSISLCSVNYDKKIWKEIACALNMSRLFPYHYSLNNSV